MPSIVCRASHQPDGLEGLGVTSIVGAKNSNRTYLAEIEAKTDRMRGRVAAGVIPRVLLFDVKLCADRDA